MRFTVSVSAVLCLSDFLRGTGLPFLFFGLFVLHKLDPQG